MVSAEEIKSICENARSISCFAIDQLLTPETRGRMGTSFGCSDFWDCLGGQALVMTDQWHSRQPLTNHMQRLSTKIISEIVAPKACTHFPYSFWNGEFVNLEVGLPAAARKNEPALESGPNLLSINY